MYTNLARRIYKFPPQSIVALPRKEEVSQVPRLPVGSFVLALFPDTSCFYRARVIDCPADVSENPFLIHIFLRLLL